MSDQMMRDRHIINIDTAFNDINGHKFACVVWKLQDQISQAELTSGFLDYHQLHLVYPSYKHASALAQWDHMGWLEEAVAWFRPVQDALVTYFSSFLLRRVCRFTLLEDF